MRSAKNLGTRRAQGSLFLCLSPFAAETRPRHWCTKEFWPKRKDKLRFLGVGVVCTDGGGQETVSVTTPTPGGGRVGRLCARARQTVMTGACDAHVRFSSPEAY